MFAIELMKIAVWLTVAFVITFRCVIVKKITSVCEPLINRLCVSVHEAYGVVLFTQHNRNYFKMVQ